MSALPIQNSSIAWTSNTGKHLRKQCSAHSLRYFAKLWSVANARILLADVDENFPRINALQRENPALEPGIVFQSFAYFIFVISLDDKKSTTRQGGFIEQRAAHKNESAVNEIIDESRMFVPEGLLTRAL